MNSSSVSTISVLVVDDEVGLRRLVSNWLGKAGFRVEQAADGVEALDLISRQHFDVVFTDIAMPNMNGITLYKNLLADYPRIKVLFTSGYADVLERFPEIKSSTLPKPYKKEDVVALLTCAAARETPCRANLPPS